MSEPKRIFSKNILVVRRYVHKWRMMVLHHYGMACACCGYADINKRCRQGKSYRHFLELDHIYGRKSEIYSGSPQSVGSGYSLYKWVVEQGFPTGFRILCRACNVAMETGEEICELHKWEYSCQ